MYTDEKVVLCQNAQDLEKFIKVFEKIRQDFGLTMNMKKTCIMFLRQFKKTAFKTKNKTEIANVLFDITIRNQKIEKVDEFNYLGYYVSRDEIQCKEIHYFLF